MGSATFTTSSGGDAGAAIRQSLAALKVITVGDLLYVGEGYRSMIREDTFNGVDANGVPFAPYSTRSPFYLYPNGAVGRSPAVKAAKATAAKNRFAKTGRIGIRTATGIKYESYAAAKAAHGVGSVNLFGMQQHPHMLDAMVVRAGGSEITQSAAGFMSGGSEMDAFQANQACNELAIGFYDDTAERAKGNNEGTSTIPKREFFALSQARIAWGERAIAERMLIRAKAGGGTAGSTSAPAQELSDDRNDWIPF
jgi:hypothetical protein